MALKPLIGDWSAVPLRHATLTPGTDVPPLASVIGLSLSITLFNGAFWFTGP
nr:hypothetical protein [Escherichia coli]